MSWVEILILAVALSMDAFAVAVCKGLALQKVTLLGAATVGIYFGVFQALMPLLGYYLGVGFSDKISSVDHWISFALLGFIGAKMIKESRESDDAVEVVQGNPLAFKKMLPLAVATSIDALAAGVTLAFLKAEIISAVSFIGITTFLLSFIGVKIGNKFGKKYKSRAELVGGIVLILMGVKIVIEHLAEG